MPQPLPPAPPCPGRDSLRDFWFGRLPLPFVEEVADHLTGCDRCAQTLDSLQSDADALVRHMQRCRPSQANTEPAWRRLEQLALKLAPNTGSLASALTTPDLAETPPPARSRLGPYQLFETLGRGGMGVVYRARHLSLHREVAIKMILAGADALADELQRFRNEGAALARLQHPNIVHLYELDEDDGRLYFTMEYAAGGTLAKKLTAGRLPPHEAVALVKELADGVQAAHDQGVIHRDLKPSNVLLSAEGTPKIVDFGLARMLDAANALTASGTVMGTPSYMAPEQTVDAGEAGPTADVWALGAILYETLTGRPPFKEETRLQTMEAVRLRKVKPPRRVNRELCPELDAICRKCLEKEPEQRYPTAAALATDLERWQRGERTSTALPRPQQPLRLRRWAIAALLVVLCGLLVLTGWLNVPTPVASSGGQNRTDGLHNGKPLILIGERGGPGESRWIVGKEKANAYLAEAQRFAAQAPGMSLLELLPSVPLDRYCFKAEVQHRMSEAQGEVGVYFAWQSEPRPAGAAAHFFCLVYNDIVDNRQLAAGLPATPGHPLPRGNHAYVHTYLHGADAAGRRYNRQLPGAVSAPFQPAGNLANRWRRLTVHVTPEQVRTWWEDQELPPITQAALRTTVQDSIRRAQFINPPAAAWMPRLAGFAPRGGLGLIVQGGVSFRNVIVEPLPGAD